MAVRSLLDITLEAATRDRQTVTTAGEPLGRLTDGVRITQFVTHADQRGSVCELFDTRWTMYPDPFASAYVFTIRPGYAKGWNLHRAHEDRYALLQGEMELVLFDPRPESPTFREVCRIVLSENRRCLINVPKDVWHADHNIGTRDVVVVNFPTVSYDHANPDKYRLPLNTDLIPYSFEGVKGW